MKIVCDACQAKYSISDDKVQGKVFKIRCKKCSNIIVVRGGAGAEAAAPPPQEKDTRVYDYGYDGGDRAPAGDESVWHVVINQDQVGPMTAMDVHRRFAGGEIDAETYVWREGFSDWLPLAQVDTFAALLASGSSPAVGAGTSTKVSAMFGGGEDAGTGRSDPGDLFAAASANAAHHDDDGGDLFGGKPAAAAASAQGGGSKLRGERNENSVLFSLNNLAQLASDKPAAPVHASPAAPASAVGGGGAPGGGGEGSGLIDIRSMASAYLGGGSGSAAKPASAGIGSIDDLPVFGGGGFSEPAVIVPMSSRTNNNKLMYALIGSVGVLAVAAVIVVVVLITGGNKPSQVAANKPDPSGSSTSSDSKPADPTASSASPGSTTATPNATKSADPTPSSSGSTAGTPPPGSGSTSPGTTSVPVKAAVTTDTHTAPPPPPTPPTHKASTPSAPPPPPPSSGSTKPKTPDKVVAKDPPPAPPTPAKSGGGGDCDEVSCVLNNNEGPCCAKFKKKGGGGGGAAAKPAGGGGGADLPEELDRGTISDGMAKVKAQVMSCGEKSPGVSGQVKIGVKVGPDGHVISTTVKNAPDGGTALANCVASMVQRATFARTQNGGAFAIPYQF